MGVFRGVLFICFRVFFTSPLIIKTRKQLRCFIIDVWFAIIIVGIIYLVFPLIVNQRDFIPHSLLGRLILYERSVDGESGALPSCHVIWAFLAALYFSRSFVRLQVDLVCPGSIDLGELYNDRCSFCSGCCCRFLYLPYYHLPAADLEVHKTACRTPVK